MPNAKAQEIPLLNDPWSIVYDLVRNQYLASNFGDGAIVAIDSDGSQTIFAYGKESSLGLHIVENTLYVACGTEGLLGYDLETAAVVLDMEIPGSAMLTDLTSDTSGFLYIGDIFSETVFRVKLGDYSHSVFLSDIFWPESILFDEHNNRLILTCWQMWGHDTTMWTCDLPDGELTLIPDIGLTSPGGVAMDNARFVYVGMDHPALVYRFVPDLSDRGMVAYGLAGISDIYFNKRDHLLCVPEREADSVTFIPIDVPQWTEINAGDIVNNGGSTQGVSWADYDNNVYLDLFVTNSLSPGGQDNWLYQNNRDRSFTRITTGAIVSDGGFSRTSTWGDCDNDGNLDCFVPNWPDAVNFLYMGDGMGSFTKVTAGPVVSEALGSQAASWGDYNNDGLLDLFVGNHGTNSLFRNDGASFTKMLSGDIAADEGETYGVAWADYDNDGNLDLFIANASGGNNGLYLNNGSGGFTKVTGQDIVSDGGESCGGSWGDYDNDGDLDLFVCNISYSTPGHNFLYTNNGDGTFARVTTGSIVTDGGYSFGSCWGDYDNDADLDLFVANSPTGGTEDFLYENNGDGTFSRVTDDAVTTGTGGSYGAAWGDYDRDGDLDLAVACMLDDNENNRLFCNNGNGSNWINIHCIGTVSNRSAIGAVVRVKTTVDGVPLWQMRQIAGQTGYCGQNSLNVHFGLDRAGDIDSLVVEWPSGMVEVGENVGVNEFLVLIEGEMDPDGDGVIGNLDNCPQDHNPDQSDSDGDRIGEACDECPGDWINDPDEDGHCGLADNCPYDYNPGLGDGDSDGVGDACDICPDDFDPDQDDPDGDGLGDACEECPGDSINDPENDDYCGLEDNCPYEYNPEQLDPDTDGVGTACDNCPDDYNPDQADLNASGIGDACEPGFTGPGGSIQVDLTDSIRILFAQVIDAGVTGVIPAASGPEPPIGYVLVPPSGSRYFDIQTDATYADFIRVRFLYDPADIGGAEEGLRIFHETTTKSGDVVWEDCTYSQDLESHWIWGEVTSLSNFVLAELACACDCHADPAQCTGTVDVLDVVQAVNVAFRNYPDVLDPNAGCPYTTTDANCTGATDVLDVVLFVNVAFRNADAASEFCDPCAP
jgi:hypothetical protein